MGLVIVEVLLGAFVAIGTTLLGALIAIGTTILIEWLRKPRLRIELSVPVDNEYIDRQAKKARFLYLPLINVPLPWLIKWMMRDTALQCHGTISFFHLDGQKVFTEEMEIRWSDTPEPMPAFLVMDEKRYPILSNFSFVTRVDICPGEHERFDVAAKFDNEEYCYGWSNETYFKGWRNPDWKLIPGRYLVWVTIISSGQKCEGLYRLLNDVSRRDFRLEDPLPEDWNKLKR
jgi:hypothetical protein